MYLRPFKKLHLLGFCFRTGQALRSEENKAMKSFEGSFCNLNFSPSTSIVLNFFFPFIDIICFFCQVLQYSRTIFLLNKLKLLKKPLFQKRRWSCDFPPRKTPVAQKHRAISRQEKMASSTPLSCCLGTPLPLLQSLCGRTDGRTDVRSLDYYVTTKILGSIGYFTITEGILAR